MYVQRNTEARSHIYMLESSQIVMPFNAPSSKYFVTADLTIIRAQFVNILITHLDIKFQNLWHKQ
jgi:hypothetical protein